MKYTWHFLYNADSVLLHTETTNYKYPAHKDRDEARTA